MAVPDHVSTLSIHILLAAVGLLVYIGTVIAFLIGSVFLLFVGIGLLAGTPIGEIIAVLSFSGTAALLPDDIFTVLAAILLLFALLPFFLDYNDWLKRVLYDRDPDR